MYVMQSTSTRLIKYGGKASLASLPSKFKETIEAASKSLEAKVGKGNCDISPAAKVELTQSVSIPRSLKPRYSELNVPNHILAGLRETTADYMFLEGPSRINLRRTQAMIRT